MKKKIIFQKCNINYIYFFLYILAYIISLIIDHHLELREFNDNDPDNIYFFINIDILEIYTFNLADFFAIIPHFISKKLSRSEQIIDNNNENKEKTELIYNEAKITGAKLRPKTIFFYLIIIAAFDFLKDFMNILYYIFFPKFKNETNPFNHTVIFEIIIQFIFSYFILRIQFFKLQHFSLYLNIIIFIIILGLDLVDILKFTIVKGFIYIFYPFLLIFYCLKSVYGKKIILYGYISIYILIIMKGAIKLVFVVVFSLITLMIDNKIFKIFGIYFSELKYIFLIIAKIIINFFIELSLWITLDRFSPNHTPIIIIGEEICNFVEDLLNKDSKFKKMNGHKYIRIFLYLISLIGVLIHNEIIVTNICGLGSDTKYFLDIVVKTDEEFTKSDNPDILKRFETLELMSQQGDENSTQNKCELEIIN